MVMQHSDTKNLSITNFIPKKLAKNLITSSPASKRLAPLAPSLAPKSTTTSQELVININENQNQLSLFSSSSSSASSNDKKLLSSSISSTSSKLIKNKTRSTTCSVSSPSSGSTSSSHESVILSSSPSPQNKLFFNNLAFDASNVSTYFEDVLIDDSGDHREMAIDCPDNFVPEIKTRPVYPPIQNTTNTIQKPLLKIINENKTFESKLTDSNEEKNLKSLSFSSIQYIDDDTRSRLNVNDTPVQKRNQVTNDLVINPTSLNQQINVDKKLIMNNFAMINDGFEHEDEHEINNLNLIKKEDNNLNKNLSINRAPTPPKPVQNTSLTCVSISDTIQNGIELITFKQTQTKYQDSSLVLSTQNTIEQESIQCSDSTLEINDIYKHIDLIKVKIEQLKTNSEFDLNKKDIEFDTLYKECDNDLNTVDCLVKTDEFKNSLSLYNKFININSKYDLKPVCTDLAHMIRDVMKFLDKNNFKLHEEKQILNNELVNESSSDLDDSFSFIEQSNELSQLLTKLDIKNLIETHDNLAYKYEQNNLKQQILNQNYMLSKDPNFNSNMFNDNQYAHSDTNLLLNQEQEIIEEHIQENDENLSDEGRFLLSKAQHYCVDNLKLVNIEKSDSPLGATIRNREGNIIISRIVIGGAAQQSGLLHEEDEILEINNIPVRGKTINDICDLLANLTGIVSFLIIPNMSYEPVLDLNNQSNLKQSSQDQKTLHLRALFNYVPQDDLYMPCKELGLAFNKGDILHIISQEDDEWWQAYKDDEKDQSLAGLIPSQMFQEKRFSQIQTIIGDSFMDRKKREKGFCIRGANMRNKRRRQFANLSTNPSSFKDEIFTYEQVCLYRPESNCKRPIVLIGPHSIGRHELRKRLMHSHPSLFEVAVPHTTRQPRRDEIDGKDYHFLPRHIFEVDIKQGRFIEHGEYEKNLYGTSREAIKKVIENSKICVLNLYPQALKTLRNSDLMPYVIYIGPPNLNKLKELKQNLNESFKENDLLDIIDKGREIEELYGHYFDKIIRNTDMDKTYVELYDTIMKVQNEENWIPACWVNK